MSENEEIKQKLADLLHSGMNLDQIITLELEMLAFKFSKDWQSDHADEINEILHHVGEQAGENSALLRQASRLVSDLH